MRTAGATLFDCSQEYEAMLDRGLRLSGERREYFMVGRVRDLQAQLPAEFVPRRILDFGCGLGDTTVLLANTFPGAQVLGMDTSDQALEKATARYGSERISFAAVRSFSGSEVFDLCYVNGVFHHIRPENRRGALEMIWDALVWNGILALFENNPWNPGTQLVMRRIPFDRDAQTLTPRQTRRLLLKAGFALYAPPRFLFYFPKPLAFLRFYESNLARLPLGAQYYYLAVKREILPVARAAFQGAMYRQLSGQGSHASENRLQTDSNLATNAHNR